MGVVYSVNFLNNSRNSGNACLFQTEASSPPDAYPVMWFAKSAPPSMPVKFQWTVDHSFVWGNAGKVVPGIIFKATQFAAADPARSNEITLARDASGAVSFTNQQAAVPAGTFSIRQESTIPANTLAVGLGMSGSPITVVSAQPNAVSAFTQGAPEYWITFGSYFSGEVLDPRYLTNDPRIVFPVNVYSMTAILNADGSWTIQPTSQVDAAFAEDGARMPIASEEAPAAGNDGGHPAPAQRPPWGEVR